MVLIVLTAGPAFAKSFSLPSAKVLLVVNEDGSVDVTEQITYEFSGMFSGSYRDIPSVDAARILRNSVTVGEVGGPQYRPGGDTILGTPGPANSFAVGDPDDYNGTRIVWRFSAANETKTFEIRYRVVGAVRLYNDTAELEYRVWGDQWEQFLGTLEAVVVTPAVYDGDKTKWRVWGNSSQASGVTEFTGNGAVLKASWIEPMSYVELRLLFPADSVAVSELVDRRDTNGFQRVIAEEKAEEQKLFDARRRENWVRENLWLVPLTMALAVFPAVVAFAWIGRYRGRDRTSGIPEYLAEPPSELSPAEVALLGKEHGDVGPQAFVATLFDLFRRRWFRVSHELVEKKTWGGLRTENVADLRIYLLDPPTDALTDYEQTVHDAVVEHVPDRGLLLGDLVEKWETDATGFHKSFESFISDLNLLRVSRAWVRDTGKSFRNVGALVATLALLAGVGIAVLETSRWGFPIWGVVLAVVGLGNLTILGFLSLGAPHALTARTKTAAAEHARWNAFRRYLADFTLLSEQPPVAIELWERLLVYAIVFGVAENVLSVAQLKAPPELAESSAVFWVDSHGSGLGSGATLLNVNRLYSGVTAAHIAGAPKPTTSSASGFGGGFSGGGGGGGIGGGGGGAW